ncbi:MAG: RusA family crossover junction endodeoxyribonuclease [Gudongella sp.]|jgi:Holliday junction resolvase RusA-like endonuclease|nr:RusA family crossover junction endodeoxyribonuclease [Gudongella sp.]
MKITIPGIPIAKGRPRLGKFGAYTPAKTVNYENLVQYCYMDQADGIKLDGPLMMEIRFYFPIPKSYSKKQIELLKVQDMAHMKKPDLDNCIKSISDALNHFAYDDDSQIVEMRALKRYTEDEPRAEVVIWEVLDHE